MKINIYIKAEPFSINNAYYRSGRKKTECKDWEVRIHTQLRKYASLLDLVNKETKAESGLSLELLFYMPKSKLYTAKGAISRKSKDLSNIEKLLIDCIFKHMPDRDDAEIVQMVSGKTATEGHEHGVRIILETL